jgi:hypothetical protein
MTSLMRAVERAREHEHYPPDGPVRMTALQARFRPADGSRSLRALLAAMNARAATRRPFAVILCRFADDAPDTVAEAPVETFFRQAFTAGSGGFVEYWRDASLGAIDVSGSRVFGWTTVDLRRDQAGSPNGRLALTEAAIRGVQAAGGDPLTGFHTQMSIYRRNWTKDGAPPNASWKTPGWSAFWIDGGTDGRSRKINLTPPFEGTATAHEMGHSLGMDHDADATGDTKYHDPACVMSQNGAFTQAPWGVNFGPALCLPHLLLQGWMYQRRMFVDTGAWAAQAEGVTFRLAPNTEPGAHAYLGASLNNPDRDPAWAYLLELVTATGWNRGVAGMPYVMIRRIAAQTDLGATPDAMYLGPVYVDPSGAATTYTEPTGNTTFTVTLTDQTGPVVSVRAKKAD